MSLTPEMMSPESKDEMIRSLEAIATNQDNYIGTLKAELERLRGALEVVKRVIQDDDTWHVIYDLDKPERTVGHIILDALGEKAND